MNTKPRISAKSTNVLTGLIRATTPAAVISTPKSPHSQRVPLESSAARANSSAANSRNISPVSTPTVVTEAWSNLSTTAAITTHSTPMASSAHQYLASCEANLWNGSSSALDGALPSALRLNDPSAPWCVDIVIPSVLLRRVRSVPPGVVSGRHAFCVNRPLSRLDASRQRSRCDRGVVLLNGHLPSLSSASQVVPKCPS